MRYLIGVISTLILTVMVIAQDSCPAIVTETILDLQEVCSDTGRNQLCYVNNQIVLETSADNVDFALPGDILDIELVDTIQTIVDSDDEAYGIALMLVQANVPDSLPGQNVTFLLFGDTQVTHSDTESAYTAMQAIYFSTGIGQLNCNDVPQSGLLIQTPEFDEPIELIINGAEISLSSTAFITAELDSEMTIYIVEGEGIVSAENESVVVPEGASTTLALDENLNAMSTPSNPEPYTEDNVVHLPIEEDLIAEPATREDIAVANVHVGTFSACWTSIDTDGSSQSLCIRAIGRNLFRVNARDEGGTVCGDTGEATEFAVQITGSGSVNDDNVLETIITYQCLGGNNANGEVPISYMLNPDGTLTDSFGVIWSR